MRIVKYPFPIDVVTKQQLKNAGFATVDDVEHYEIRPVPKELPVMEDGKSTGMTLADYEDEL